MKEDVRVCLTDIARLTIQQIEVSKCVIELYRDQHPLEVL